MHDRKGITERYAEFMGSWMAGAAVGHVAGKIVVFILVVWLLGKYACN